MSQPGQGDSTALDFEISMAFQPIVDVDTRQIYAYEALVRGADAAPAASVVTRVTDENRYAFDQRCRVRAIELAVSLGMKTMLSINFMPNAVFEPTHCLQATLEAAHRTGFPIERIILETTEDERVIDPAYVRQIFATYRGEGFKTAIDDFGAGYAGLSLLADFQPDIIKIDMALVRGIAGDRPRQVITGALAAVGDLLGIEVVAEGVERKSEALVLRRLGIRLMQGHLFAKPAFEALPTVDFDVLLPSTSQSVNAA